MTCQIHRQPDSGDEWRSIESFRYFPTFTGSAGLSRLDPEWIGILSQKVCGARELLFGEAESKRDWIIAITGE
jgi:hypothetical protein